MEKVLLGTFSVIVKLQTSRSFVSSSNCIPRCPLPRVLSAVCCHCQHRSHHHPSPRPPSRGAPGVAEQIGEHRIWLAWILTTPRLPKSSKPSKSLVLYHSWLYCYPWSTFLTLQDEFWRREPSLAASTLRLPTAPSIRRAAATPGNHSRNVTKFSMEWLHAG